MSAVNGINHITFAVRDLKRSLDFYQGALGLVLKKRFSGGAYLEAGKLWVCLSEDKNARSHPHHDYTHVAFDADSQNFDQIKSAILSAGGDRWKENTSEGKSFYFTDPDGHKLELHIGNLQSRIEHMEKAA